MLLKTLPVLLVTALAAADICGPVYQRKNTAGLLCNAQGSVARPAPLTKATTISTRNIDAASAACRNICLENNFCKGFSFNTRTRSCQQYSKDPANQGFKASGNTRNFFTNRFCYIQNFQTAPGLQNAGFDGTAYGSKFLSPWSRESSANAQNTLPSRYSGGYNSPYAALLQVGTSLNSNTASISQSFDICPNTTLNIYPMYKYLGQGNSSSFLGLRVVGAVAGAGSECFSSFHTYFGRDKVSQEWASYPKISRTSCSADDDTTDCAPLKMTVVGGQYPQTIAMTMSAGYNSSCDTGSNLAVMKRDTLVDYGSSRDCTGFPAIDPPPALDQWLVDFVVEKKVSEPSDNPNNPYLFCNTFFGPFD